MSEVGAERAAAEEVRRRIDAAAKRAGRDASGVILVAATKGVAPRRILASGIADVGENRAQDLIAKQRALTGAPIRWHFIGALQRNKVRSVVGRVALIHSVESAELGREISSRSAGAAQGVLVEVNLSAERAKHGVAPDDLGVLLEELTPLAGLRVRGLMTVPAASSDPEASRPAFRRLRELRDTYGLQDLSMGMTGDFEVAVEEGATMIRIGTAIFGHRAG